MTPTSKLLIIGLVMGFTALYSVVERRKIEALQVSANAPILKEIPSFTALDVYSGEEINKENVFDSSRRGLFVHFWGTWCAPCEAELPEFIEFAEKFEGLGVGFVLLAVNDERDKVERFLAQRIKHLPENVIVAIDAEGASLPLFGTIKVPETYLFHSGDGRTLTKFIGPQDWTLRGFVDRTNKLLIERSPSESR